MQTVTNLSPGAEITLQILRLVIAIVLLIALTAIARWAIHRFANVKTFELHRTRFTYAGFTLLGYLLLVLVRPFVEAPFTASGRWLSSILGISDPDWLPGVFLGFFETLVATFLLLLGIQLVGLLYAFLGWRIESWRARGIAAEDPGRPNPRRILANGLQYANRTARYLFLGLLFLVYVPHVMRSYPRSRQFIDSLLPYFQQPLSQFGEAFLNYLPNVAYLLVLCGVGWAIVKALKAVFRAIETGAIVIRGFPADWANPTFKLLRFLIVAFFVMESYPFLPGSNSEFFKGFSVFLGALLTFGSAGAIGNIVAGFVLTYSKAFRIGDVVRIGDVFGKVVEKSVLSTRIRTWRNEEVTFPNGSVLNGSVTNYTELTAVHGLALTVVAGIGYDVDWRTVHKLMLEGAERTQRIMTTPAPCVVETDFGNYSVSYELFAWTDSPDHYIYTKAELYRNVLDAFNKAGVEIMTPSVLSHRDASNLAVPLERFPNRPRPHGIAVNLEPPPPKA
jgi:small-conductance mechanosensitive channel